MPPLQKAIDKHGITLNHKYNLKAVDGPAKKAIFAVSGANGQAREVVRDLAAAPHAYGAVFS